MIRDTDNIFVGNKKMLSFIMTLLRQSGISVATESENTPYTSFKGD